MAPHHSGPPPLAPEAAADIPAEARALIGVARSWRCLVTERDIRHFTQAIGELDGVVDESLPSRPLLAPPLFFQTMTYDERPFEALTPDGAPAELAVPVPAQRAMGGMSDYTLFRPARAGETVTVVSTLTDVKRKEGSRGTLWLVVVETRFLDDSGAPLAVEVATYVKQASFPPLAPHPAAPTVSEPPRLTGPSSLPPLIVTPTPSHLFMFSAATWNRHRIHYEHAAAVAEGHPGVVVQRALMGNYLARLVTGFLAGRGALRSLSWKVLRSAGPGKALRAQGTIERVEPQPGGERLFIALELRDERDDVVAAGRAEADRPLSPEGRP